VGLDQRTCIKCEAPFIVLTGRGRPRVRCYACQPSRAKPSGPSNQPADALVGEPARRQAARPPASVSPPSVPVAASPAPVAETPTGRSAPEYLEAPEPAPVFPGSGAPREPGRLYGHAEPRIHTPPLRPLTRETTLGYQVVDFADHVGYPLFPWQREVVLRGMELTEDGELRFRVVIVLVARQQGKTQLSRMLSLWRLYARRAQLVLGAAQDVDKAKETWEEAVELAQDVPALTAGIDHVRRTNGQLEFKLTRAYGGGKYKITATNEKAGRGKSVDHLVFDELRTQTDMAAWASLRPTISAKEEGQIWALSNAGDDHSVVLNQLREAALTGRDESICLLEYSAPEGCELADVEGWRHANPSMGHIRSMEKDIRSRLVTDPPALFRTETLCQRVEQLSSALDQQGWRNGTDEGATLEPLRATLAMGVDVAADGEHVTAVIAAELPDGRVRVQVVGAWQSTTAARPALRDLVTALAPQTLAWFPGGPAVALATDLGRLDLPVIEVKGAAVGVVCQELADLIRNGHVLHARDDLLDAHVQGATRVRQGDGWRFGRAGRSHVDAAYALAGAVHAARNLPTVTERVEPLLLAAW
jgi:hypothetical protein